MNKKPEENAQQEIAGWEIYTETGRCVTYVKTESERDALLYRGYSNELPEWKAVAVYIAPPSAPVGQKPVSGVVLRDGNPTLLQDKHIKASDVRLYAAPLAAQAVDLFDDFSESKDWRESDYNGRIDWLKAMHASQRAEIVRLQNDVEILRALIYQQAGSV
jgi:hypothetical protein